MRIARSVRILRVSHNIRQPFSTKPRLRNLTDTMSEYFNQMLAYLRVPVLASSGLAVLISGLLYFKQKCAFKVAIHDPG
jgi:hypothetical protein